MSWHSLIWTTASLNRDTRSKYGDLVGHVLVEQPRPWRELGKWERLALRAAVCCWSNMDVKMPSS